MNWLDRAESRFGHLAIQGVPQILVGLNLLSFILHKFSPAFFDLLTLEPALVMHGQVWRLVTFIFIPGFGSIFGDYVGLLFYLLILNFFGSGLEQALGAFKFNVYYGLGMVGVMIAAMFFGGQFAPFLLNTTILFGFARFFPDTIIYLMFILPVKVKWLAWLSAAGLVFNFVVQGWDYRVPLLVCLANYILFFGREHYTEARQRAEVTTRRQRFESDMRGAVAATLHECAVCGVTEAKDPYMDFRVARDGQEYCAAHLPKAAPEIA